MAKTPTPTPTSESSWWERAATWVMGNKAPAASAVSSVAKSALPIIEELVEVAAHGNSESNKKRLFFLAMAVATGQIRDRNALGAVGQFVVPTPFYLSAEYDMMGKSVTVTLHYTYAGLAAQLGSVPGQLSSDPIFDSVSEELLAGDLKDFKYPSTSLLPDAKGTILATGLNPSNNPDSLDAKNNPPPPGSISNLGQPVGERKNAWGTSTASLVYAALSSPCTPVLPASGYVAVPPGGPTIPASSAPSSMASVIQELLGGFS